MTYCVGLCLQEGLVLLSDTRTNAGPDSIASFGKMQVVAPGDRVIAMMSAGNLAVTQAVVSRVTEGAGLDPEQPFETLFTVKSMYEAAELVGAAIKHVYQSVAPSFNAQSMLFDASIILAGQIGDRRMRMFHVYSAGNFIESSQDTPFFQIGETKYGKPILDRVAQFDTPLEDAVKLALISMDSTLRSNFSVGLPADLLVYRRDTNEVAVQHRFGDDDPYFQHIRTEWSEALRKAYRDLPTPPWMA
ncbi:MAG: peptidase [Hyphomonadaceae bacterium]